MEKIILYYKYIQIEHPEIIASWQRALCSKLGLTGRVIIACEGINGTLGGTEVALHEYEQAMDTHPLFGNIDFKESPGSGRDFPRLRVVVKKEIVKLGISPYDIPADQAADHLTPTQAHELIASKKDLVLFDARNNYESRIGAFVGALTPDIKNFRELPSFIDENLDLFKDKEVLMYCTGGVRCERASAYLAAKNIARTIYQIEGGIHRYLEAFPDGFFRGKNFVFDARMALATNPDILGHCQVCQIPYDTYNPCGNVNCNGLVLVCPACLAVESAACSIACAQKIKSDPTKQRNLSHPKQSCSLQPASNS